MATLTATQLEETWIESGGDQNSAATAAAVALAESGGDPSSIDNTAYPDRPGYHKPAGGAQKEYSVGLWQINVLAHPTYSADDLLNPRLNAQAAIAISKDGADFDPWSTFTSGVYRKFLPATVEAAKAVTALLSRSTKPRVRPWITLPALSTTDGVDVPASVTASIGGVWHALGSHLPTAINRNRAARRAMLRMVR